MIDLFFRFDEVTGADAYAAFTGFLRDDAAAVPQLLQGRSFSMMPLGRLAEEPVTLLDEAGEPLPVETVWLPGLHVNLRVRDPELAAAFESDPACLGATDASGNTLFGSPPAAPRCRWYDQ